MTRNSTSNASVMVLAGLEVQSRFGVERTVFNGELFFHRGQSNQCPCESRGMLGENSAGGGAADE